MSYLKITQGDPIWPYELSRLKADFPDTSFPQPYERAEGLSDFGVFKVVGQDKPVFNSLTHTCIELHPVLTEGAWVQQWSVTVLSIEDAASALAQARKRRWREVKDIRDNKIQNGGVLFNEQWYPLSTEAKTQILWVKAIGTNTGQRIELMDGSMANLTVNRANDLLAAGATQLAAISANADALKVLIDASTDPSTVDIDAGWPATFV